MLAEDSFAVDFSCTTCGKIINALTCPSHCPQCQTAAPDHGFPTAEAVTIAEQNDRFRAGLTKGNASDLRGQVVVTSAVNAMGRDFVTAALMAVAGDSTFTPDNDPYGDHGFGTVTVLTLKLFWKIDLYDEELVYGSPAPANPAVTRRVLTIMFPSDY
ncbi:DUF3768 domain-containing protein [Paracoccus sp. YLB-12]|uniref:DUF3768 domain-containing protein n=1 Tax=Paracoccus maritimus TaxID=2933292 RepID=A0ABT2KDT0_9RHOB|nr:DUF3768 domain-containing protein [Paracoccus sp. YLB-12]MCT4334521.1 DUF3768 domain-containing protein [Paracoccus sp. YLB-12]